MRSLVLQMIGRSFLAGLLMVFLVTDCELGHAIGASSAGAQLEAVDWELNGGSLPLRACFGL